ncbi:MAG: UDP-N-acetylglucosamine--N-acetylmuramyl-(pentapeptide) pyrophosphoryl-undecaprenol N-acetylglucosamine transferase [Christensenellaceae bacterium]|jgi:UDP-N-acetylglucosamine--N-acetylmuramyl-(pentapeptide) pyrophosphoryl-undecaprenol N-acetylglucosamine transferase|nr:UDP-N-acetylglucosamine--N-acetylmuramyl-(pentapeptide) pyrophosphoryl-undecaprenol N-acetylglucosamine transferase [Christensenellaceae bacterium]
MYSIALTGGGTAGHVIPNLAIVPELLKYFDKIIYIGSVDGIEKQLVSDYGVSFFSVNCIKFNRSNIISNIKIPYVLCRGIAQAKKILLKELISVVFSKGGYVSLPTCLAANSLKIPVIVHESDFSLGLANRITSLFAKQVLTSFSETKGGVYTGNPIRSEIFNGNAALIKTKYGFDNRPVVLIFGGSSGSLAINSAVYPIVMSLTKNYNIIHITGKQQVNITTHGYVQLSYAKNICDYYAAADAIVIRGGANSLCEAIALRKKILCIPLPKGRSSRGDQSENVNRYSETFLRVLEQSKLTPTTLLSEIDLLFSMPDTNEKMQKTNTNAIIVGEIIKHVH